MNAENRSNQKTPNIWINPKSPAKALLSKLLSEAFEIPQKAMTPIHPMWTEFVVRLQRQLDPDGGPNGCRHDYRIAEDLLREFGADVPLSLNYFREHGGHCDCEVILNVILPWMEPTVP